MPPVLPHFSPPSDAMAALPPDPARLQSTGPDSLVMTGMPVPAVMGSWWDIAFGWERGEGEMVERGVERGRSGGRGGEGGGGMDEGGSGDAEEGCSGVCFP